MNWQSDSEAFLRLFPGTHLLIAMVDGQQRPRHFGNRAGDSNEVILTEFQSVLSADERLSGFYTVNEFDQTKDPDHHRTLAMCVRLRCVYVDDDNPTDNETAYRTEWPLAPSLVVRSSAFKRHYLWLIRGEWEDAQEWREIQNGLANQYGGDNQAKDQNRYLRLPGTYNRKPGAPPWLVDYIHAPYLYTRDQIVGAFPRMQAAPPSLPKGTNPQTTVLRHFADPAEALRSVAVDGENHHAMVRHVAMYLANKYVDREFAEIVVRTSLEASAARDPHHWNHTQYTINRQSYQQTLNSAYAKIKMERSGSVNIEDLDLREKKVVYDIEKPPGFMGQLVDEILESSPHPNQEAAIAGAFMIVASIVGRRWSVNGAGLNLFMLLIGKSGVGKDTISKMQRRILNQVGMRDGEVKDLGLNSAAAMFAAPFQDITGEKAVIRNLTQSRCHAMVIDEYGKKMLGRVGDMAGFNNLLLSLYSMSDIGGNYPGRGYADDKASIPPVVCPALTVLGVTTPEPYHEAIKKNRGDAGGEVSRFWHIETKRLKSYLNLEVRREFSTDLIETIEALIMLAQTASTEDVFDRFEVKPGTINIKQESDEWTDLENRLSVDDQDLMRASVSRSFLKVLKIAAIMSVADDVKDADGNFCLGELQFKWAKTAIGGEREIIVDSRRDSEVGEIDVMFDTICVPKIIKMLTDKGMAVKARPPKELASKGIFSKSNLDQALRGVGKVKGISSDAKLSLDGRTGAEKLIAYGLRSGFMRKMTEEEVAELPSKRRLRSVYYQLNEGALETLKSVEG